MRGARDFLVLLGLIGYWVSSIVVLVASWLARAASEEPPYHEERLLVRLALASCLLASGVGVGWLLGRAGLLLLALWAIQTALVAVAWVSTLDVGGVRVAPPVLALCLAGQLAGLVALLLGWRAPPRLPVGADGSHMGRKVV